MISKIIIVGWTLLVGYLFIHATMETVGPGPATDTQLLGVFFSALFFFVLWIIIAVPTYMIGRLFQRRYYQRDLPAPPPPPAPDIRRGDIVSGMRRPLSTVEIAIAACLIVSFVLIPLLW